LTGIVAGMIAQHPHQALEATALAVYLHGLAGDIASRNIGEGSLVATDLVRYLPEAFANAHNLDASGFRIHS
jgi:ADP-dependent NAD(P)H-hydrate dehydratase / NAD(P)H-hydrate epimerase